MHAFDYVAPLTLAEVLERIAQGADRSIRMLAGGTDLTTQIKAGRRQPGLIVDLKRIPGLMRLEFSPESGLVIGAAVPCVRLQEDPSIRRHYPILAHVSSIIGSYQIQCRASLGGNLCNASPSADGIPALIVLGAVAHTQSPRGARDVPVESFCTSPGRTVLTPDELLVELRIPAPPARFGAVYERFIPRNEMDIAVAGAGSAIRLDEAGRVAEARIALAAVAPVPLRVRSAEAILIGSLPTPGRIAAAAQAAAAECTPITDVRGSAAYRKHLVHVLTMRTLEQAVKLAKEDRV